MQGACRLVDARILQAGEIVPDVVGAQAGHGHHSHADGADGTAGDDCQRLPQRRVFHFAGHILFNGTEDAAQRHAEVGAFHGHRVLEHRLPVGQMPGLVL